MKLFAKADKADRANKRDAKTAKMFYVSGVFIEILNQFGPLNEDMGGEAEVRGVARRGAQRSREGRQDATCAAGRHDGHRPPGDGAERRRCIERRG